MSQWFKGGQVKSVAMESTGVRRVPGVEILEQYELKVHLVNARHAKGMPGRKSDVQDCQRYSRG